MLEAYLSSVLIFTIMIGAIGNICEDFIKNNHWLDGAKPNMRSRFINTVIVAAIPLLRVGVIIMYFYMSARTKEEFEEWMKTRL